MTQKKVADEEFVEVYSGTQWQAQIVKGLLQANGIEAIVLDNSLSAVTSPYLGLGGDVTVTVSPDNKELALKTISENEKEVINCN